MELQGSPLQVSKVINSLKGAFAQMGNKHSINVLGQHNPGLFFRPEGGLTNPQELPG